MKRYYWDGRRVFFVVEYDDLNAFKSMVIYLDGKRGHGQKGVLYVNGQNSKDGTIDDRHKRVLESLLSHNGTVLSYNTISKLSGESVSYLAKFVSNYRSVFKWSEAILETDRSRPGYAIHVYPVNCFFKTDYNDEEYNIPQGFVSRNQEIDNLINLFEESKVCAICGERGLGKTELVHSFARECKQRKIFDHIIFTHYDTSIEKTISNLETYANPLPGFEDRAFDEKIYLLSEIAKDQNCLLIIDNYDNPEDYGDIDTTHQDYHKELSSDKGPYRQLINTGWKVLFTSKTDLTNCPYIGKHIFNLKPFKTNELIYLFCEVADSDVLDSDLHLLRVLINDYLKNNTYLVVLTAMLLTEMTLPEIYEYFKSGRVNEMTEPIEPNKDNQLQEPDSLFNHYCAVLLKNPLLKNKVAKKLLFNIALFPLKGVDYEMFFRAAFLPEQICEAKKIFKSLCKHYLVFKQNSRVYLHPLIRELVLDRITDIDELYIHQILFNGLEVQTYTEHYPDWYSLCNSIETALASKFENKKISTFTSACILALISSIKAIVNDETIAYEYGLRAIKMFRKFNDFDYLTIKELYLLARSYNVSAYSILQKKIEEDSTQEKEYYNIVLDTIDNTMSVVESILSELLTRTCENQELSEKVRVLQSKIHSNIGACYYKIGKYDDALHWHKTALNERLVFSENNPCEKNDLLLAVSYRCLGSDLYYMAEGETSDADKLSDYFKSYNYHRMSVELYRKLDYKKIDRYISYYRLIGSAIEILLLCNKLSLSLETYDVDKYDNFFVMLCESAQYLTQAEIPNYKLFEECLKHTNDLLCAITLIGDLSTVSKNYVSTIIESFCVYGELPEKPQKLLSQLENSLSHFKK